MKIAIFIILFSWFLNACMDAIDHGKGAEKLNLLWHALKWCSYALPFGYILYITGQLKIVPMSILTVSACIIWEVTYRFLRHIDFWEWDNII